jgi:hypothetical protein
MQNLRYSRKLEKIEKEGGNVDDLIAQNAIYLEDSRQASYKIYHLTRGHQALSRAS